MRYHINNSPPGYIQTHVCAHVSVSRDNVNGIARLGEITHRTLARKCWDMKKPKTMKLGEKVAFSAVKKKRHSRDDINSESRSRVCKKYSRKEEQQSPVMAVTVRSWVLSRIFLPKLCTSVSFFSLARAHIVNFITRKKFPPSIPGISDAFFLRKVY